MSTSADVFVGAPDISGAILSGPETDTIPVGIDDFVDTGLEAAGFINEDGVEITPSDSTGTIKDWSGAEIRRILTEFTGEVSWTHLALDATAARNYFGDDQVDVTAATASSGTQMRASLGKNVLPTKSWHFKIKDGDRRLRVLVPHGQVTSRGAIPLTSTGAITLPVTLTTYPDANGQNIYIYSDNGVYSA